MHILVHKDIKSKKSYIPNINRTIIPVVIKSVLGPNCKRLRRNAIRKNFNPKPNTKIKMSQFITRGNYIYQFNEVKEKLSPVFFIYVWTEFEHQVKDMFASQTFQTFSNLWQPETHSRHAWDAQRASAILSSTKIIQNSIITVHEVEPQKTVNTKTWTRTNWNLEVIIKIIHHISRES